MVIDIHSHILPGIDDGARNMKETIEMIKIAVEEGIGAIVTTPHYEVGVEQEVLSKYQEVYEEVLQYITTHQIPLKLYQGNEIYYSGSVPERLQDGEIHTINGTRYILVEFSMGAGYPSIERALSGLLYAGYWPVMAHAERYPAMRNLQRVQELVRMGVYIQINANAIIGKEGWHAKYFCQQLMKKDLVHAIGTDSHGSRHRRPMIKECLKHIDKKMGRAYRKQISEENPLKILKGEKICGKD